MDEGLSRAVMKVFVQLYNAQGLIYKDKRLVNWDPEAADRDLSDLEVQQVEVKGQPPGTSGIRSRAPTTVSSSCATTRPETMLGLTYRGRGASRRTSGSGT